MNAALQGILYDDGQIKKNMIQNSNFIITLGSSEKIDTGETYFVSHLKDIDVLVTNISPEEEILQPYKKQVTVL